MKKNVIFWIICSILFLNSCGGIVIVTSKNEKVKDYKVESDAKPTELINRFLNNPEIDGQKNYCITFFDIYCGNTNAHINYCDSLFEETKDKFEWIAVTIYDSITEKKYLEKIGHKGELKYKYTTFYEIEGLQSSLRNLHFDNNASKSYYLSSMFVIVNDSIKHIFDGGIHTEEIYAERKIILDSLSQVR